jgi:3'-phosphoadenosine 5'-phosphosulfate sulfotransferase (PAPS reductase)/FAD synthetase
MTGPHIVNVSGGKDSAACAVLAAKRGRPFRLVMADTGNEHELTIAAAHDLAAFCGVPLEIVRADFSDRIAGKRRFVEIKWREQGVAEPIVQAALDVLQPTGVPFLDLCIWKGRFPSRKAQFCTEHLKAEAVDTQVVAPALAGGNVVQWLGVRRDESLNRRNSPMFQRVRREGRTILFYRPLVDWTADKVFAFLRAEGAPINPLYRHGMSRVGCFPCINANKGELAQIGRRFPEAVKKIAAWERIVAQASKRGKATFFAPDVTPEGAALAAKVSAAQTKEARNALSWEGQWPDATNVFDWAKTARGGKQYDLFFTADDGLACSSQYGLCE